MMRASQFLNASTLSGAKRTCPSQGFSPVLYEEKSGETILECSPYSVHGMQLLCWYSKKTMKEGYPRGIFYLLHLDMGKNPAKGEVLVEDSPEAYDFVWRKSGEIVFVGQWGCQEFACQGDTPQSMLNRPVEFRQTSFKEFPKNKIIKTLDRNITQSLTWVSGNGRYVTWAEGDANPFLIGYSAVRKYLDLDNGGPIRVLGEDSTLVNADASDKYITFYSDPASKLYLVNPQDNTAIVLQTDSKSEDANNGRLYSGNLAIFGDSVAWITTKSAPPEASLQEAMKNYRATLHIAKIAPASS
ncbi:hypothetical protein [Mobiluncus mulieris]|uniref:hypothetical protein n=1 Tax=Mobiluncus mulieris TaxID=2052 RepID=UPI0020160A65|nr:hypothetical protein [Mobiluncus mulieris]